MQIENKKECFVQLWLQLERTRQLLTAQHNRFCVRRILKSWLGTEATDDLIWEVCLRASRPNHEVFGLDQLPPPSTHPRVHREVLCALIMVKLRLGKQNVRLRDLDEAYRVAFPHSTPLNVGKKRRGKVVKRGVKGTIVSADSNF